MLKTHHACGFTIVELMIGLAIIAIVVFSAIPSYTAWMQNTKIRNAADSVLNGLQLARAEAIQRNSNVQFAIGADSGWIVSVIAPVADVVQTRTAGQGSAGATATVLPAGASAVTFNSLGRVVANADGSASITEVTFDVAAALPETLTRELRVTVSPAGRARMCDPNVSEPTDIRNCAS